jgi:putative heme-binding domain-containing protein
VSDPYLPLMTWWALESKCGSDRAAVLALFTEPSAGNTAWSQPMVAQHIAARLMRRFAVPGTREDLLSCAQLLKSAAGQTQLTPLMSGFELAFKGRSFGSLPSELIEQLKRTQLAESLTFRARTGDAAAIDEALKQFASEQTPLPLRLELAEVLCDVDHSGSVPVLLQVLESPAPDALRIAAITALGRHADETIGVTVVKLFDKFTPDVAASALTLLVSRPNWTLELLGAVADKRIAAQSISADTVRQMLMHSEPRVAELVARQWGEIHGPTGDEMRKQIQSLSRTLSTGAGNPYIGRKLFESSCGKCHSLFGLGGKIGPDLTPVKRDDISTMLLNIVNPSAEVREGYETYVALTTDGQVMTGFLTEQDEKIVALRTQDGQTIRLPRDEIEELKKSAISLMPENLLKGLTEQELRDLFAYLRSSQPGR